MISKSFLETSPLGFHRIAYTEWGKTSATPPVICVHGLMRNGRDFDRLAAALQNERHVFCPDIVGRGRSDRLADPKLYTNTLYAEHMVSLIARTDAEQVDWVGTSMGGIIGMMLAAMPNTPVRRLVINDMGALVPEAALQRIGNYISTKPLVFDSVAAAERQLRENYAPFGLTREEDWRDFLAHSHVTRPDGKVAFAVDPHIAVNFVAAMKDVDLWPIYDRITCPVLLLRGAESDVLPANVAEEMTRRGPKARLVTFSNIGHAPPLMNAEQIGIVRDFLATSSP